MCPATGASSITSMTGPPPTAPDVTQLTLACGPDHKLVEAGWTTKKRANGDTEWLSPPHLDYGQPRINMFHRPEKLLCDDGDDEDRSVTIATICSISTLADGRTVLRLSRFRPGCLLG
jgi:hypothetical protein